MITIILRWLALFLIGAFLFILGVYFGRMIVFQEHPLTLLMAGAVFSLGFSLLYMMATRDR